MVELDASYSMTMGLVKQQPLKGSVFEDDDDSADAAVVDAVSELLLLIHLTANRTADIWARRHLNLMLT